MVMRQKNRMNSAVNEMKIAPFAAALFLPCLSLNTALVIHGKNTEGGLRRSQLERFGEDCGCGLRDDDDEEESE